MNIDLQRVFVDQKQTLLNIMQFYNYEFSKYMNIIRLEEDGLYAPFNLDEYWTNSNKHPFVIKVDGELAGFVLVNSDAASVNTIAEFFVMRKFEGKGVGRTIAIRIFDMYQGEWVVTQSEKNYPAQAFWRSTISKYTAGNFSERYDERRRSVQQFISKKSQ